jgi:hypothetical protein
LASSLAGGSHRRAFSPLVALVLTVAVSIGFPLVDPRASVASGTASQPVAVIVVGPAAGRTAEYVLEAKQIAQQARAYGATVREVYSPSATWTKVKEAARGANLFVYLGRGRGSPGPYGAFDSRRMDGLGLNRSAGGGHSNVVHYGESYVRRELDLAAGAIVILKRVPYAAGSSEPGRANPSLRTAVQRADNYAAGFLAAGASAVFASDRAVGTIMRDLFRSDLSLRAVFWNSPSTSTQYDSAFRSRRTPGGLGLLAPYSRSRYFQSVVGNLGSTALDWRYSWDALAAPAQTGVTVRVSSVPSLLNALADNAVSEIVVANGTYRVDPAYRKTSQSLWIGSRFAGRTRPVTVRAETTGGVTFDGGGTAYFGGITFVGGAHHQTWQGFTFANGTPTSTGVVTFGGYAGQAAPHHITLRDVTIPASVTSTSVGPHDHAVYFSWAVGGPHDLVIDGLVVDGRGGVDSALHFYHSDAANANAWNVKVRRLRVTGTWQAIILWDDTLHNITIEDARITDVRNVAVVVECPGANGIVFSNVTSTGSAAGKGFYSSLGDSPPGVTFVNSSFD